MSSVTKEEKSIRKDKCNPEHWIDSNEALVIEMPAV